MRVDGGAEGLALSVHGPAGVLDFVVPGGASAWDVAREYAEAAGLAAIPLIYTRTGEALAPDAVLAERGFASGDLLVAAVSAYRPPARRGGSGRSAAVTGPTDPAWVALCSMAAAAGVVAGLLASRADDATWRTPPVALLLLAAVVGVLPWGRLAAPRALAAPAFAGAAAYALAWRPGADQQPAVVAVCGLAVAVAAGVAWLLGPRAREGLLVWGLTGLGLAAVCALGSLPSWPTAAVWSLVVLAALLAARLIPELAVGVPDRMLLDLDRLAAGAWSARDPVPLRRGRLVVPTAYVADLAHRGARVVAAGAGAVGVLAVGGSVALLDVVERPIDVLGARVLVGCAAASLLLVARSHRHAAARLLLRAGGLGSAAVLAVSLLAELASTALLAVLLATVVAAGGAVAAAVAIGRGWRSVRWIRWADVAEAVCGAVALGAGFVAGGGFRLLMDLVAAHSPS